MLTPLFRIALLPFSFLLAGPVLAGAKAPVQVWGQQLGTTAEDFAKGLAVDAAGNCFIAGNTGGDLAGANAGKLDVVVGKFDTEGHKLWLIQLGTAEDDSAKAVALGVGGAVFVAGETHGKLADSQFGMADGFLAKFDAQGKVEWVRQFGTAADEEIEGVVCDAVGDVFVAGSTSGRDDGTELKAPDATVRKFDRAGQCVWTRQWGTETADSVGNIAVDAKGYLYVAGTTGGDLGGKGNAGLIDVFVTKLDPAGTVVWNRQFGTAAHDMGMTLLVDPTGPIYIGGSTGGDFAASQVGQGDAVVLKLSPDGELLWVRQFGTKGWDGIHGLALPSDGVGAVIVGGCQAYDQCEGFFREFDADGNELWQTKIATEEKLCGTRIGVDGRGNLYQVGGTHGSAFSPFVGTGNDIILARLSPER